MPVSATAPAGIPAFANIAHRGASGHAPEATRAAFDRAVAMGADYLEMDIQLSRDGHPVAIHDTLLDRTTDGHGPVGALTLAELTALDAGSWFNRAYPERADPAFAGARLLSLDAILTAFGRGQRYYIETKSPERYPGIERVLIDTLARHGLTGGDRVLLQSFSPESLAALAALAPELPRIQLLAYAADGRGGAYERDGVTGPPGSLGTPEFQRIAERAAGIGLNAWDGGQAVIDAAFIRRAHQAGLLVHVYTVDEPAAMAELMDAGVDGIFTNFPDRLAACRT